MALKHNSTMLSYKQNIFVMCIFTCIKLNTVLSNADLGYCEKTDKNCNKHSNNFYQQKFIFYDVNPPEGFNLRRDVYIRFANMLAEASERKEHLNFNLVLPPWYNLYHWDINDKQPKPWSNFFDINSLKSYAPVLELTDVFRKGKIEIDHLYVLQNYPDAFEDGDFKEKWEIVESKCDYKTFWGYSNITAQQVVCVRFQGKASQLWEIIDLYKNDRYIMFAHGEIPLHDSYGSKQYWDCRKSMKFNHQLVNIATDYIKTNLNCTALKCDTYMSVHWRRGDFARSRSKDVPSIQGTAKQIIQAIKKHKLNVHKIFIATDAWENEIRALKQLIDKSHEVHFYVPSVKEIEMHRDGGIAIIEQIIASRAKYFLGTHESTFTFRIQEEREILGFDSDTTFNRLCPDTGYCEKPSRWTIVN